MFHLILRRAPLLLWFLALLFCAPLRAQDAETAPAPPTSTTITITQNAPREGTPSFLGAVDSTLQTWSRYFRTWGPYLLLAVALAASYLVGLLVYKAAFGLGSFAPKAGALGAWFTAVVALFFGLMMLPQNWPWWSPYALIFFGIALTAITISTLSKKAV